MVKHTSKKYRGGRKVRGGASVGEYFDGLTGKASSLLGDVTDRAKRATGYHTEPAASAPAPMAEPMAAPAPMAEPVAAPEPMGAQEESLMGGRRSRKGRKSRKHATKSKKRKSKGHGKHSRRTRRGRR